MTKRWKLLLWCLIVLAGCGVKQQVQGQYYLNMEKYAQGQQTFAAALEENPSDGDANYYMGRFLMAEKKPAKALPYLEKAALLAPDRADYHFWLGMARGETGNPARERESYERALAIDDEHLQALTYLGHNQLKAGEGHAALKTYSKVLELWPTSPSALYNRGLILKELGRTPEEKRAWQWYIYYYPDGPLARRAVDHLNRLGDFEYRRHLLGQRTVVLRKINFEPFGKEPAQESLYWIDRVGEVVTNAPDLTLHLLVYQLNNKDLAKQRALSLRQTLLHRFPRILPDRIKVSWFDVPEKITVGKKVYEENESVNLFAFPEKPAQS